MKLQEGSTRKSGITLLGSSLVITMEKGVQALAIVAKHLPVDGHKKCKAKKRGTGCHVKAKVLRTLGSNSMADMHLLLYFYKSMCAMSNKNSYYNHNSNYFYCTYLTDDVLTATTTTAPSTTVITSSTTAPSTSTTTTAPTTTTSAPSTTRHDATKKKGRSMLLSLLLYII